MISFKRVGLLDPTLGCRGRANTSTEIPFVDTRDFFHCAVHTEIAGGDKFTQAVSLNLHWWLFEATASANIGFVLAVTLEKPSIERYIYTNGFLNLPPVKK